jgi:ssDNA-specific exonuclease RecJ
MTQLTISIPDEKLNFILELFKNLGFVKIESVDGKPYGVESTKEEINS